MRLDIVINDKKKILQVIFWNKFFVSRNLPGNALFSKFRPPFKQPFFQTTMSERFDTLFSGMSEETAMSTLPTPTEELSNPGLKYLAATRLGACSSAESLDLLLQASANPSEDLYERITRRKARPTRCSPLSSRSTRA